ncbi:unnamed protein product, partial [Medioppia subpectinata]
MKSCKRVKTSGRKEREMTCETCATLDPEAEEAVVLTNPILTNLYDCGTGWTADERPQHRIHNFAIHDSDGTHCWLDSRPIDELFLCGFVAPIVSHLDTDSNDRFVTQMIGPLQEWWFAGFDGGSQLMIGCESEFASYVLSEPNPRFKSLFTRSTQNMYLTKLVIESLLKTPDSSYEDLVESLEERSQHFSEELLLQFAPFISEQIKSFDSAAEDDEMTLFETPAIQTLVQMSGVDNEDKSLSKSISHIRPIARVDARRAANSDTLTFSTPLVTDLFNKIFKDVIECNSKTNSLNKLQTVSNVRIPKTRANMSSHPKVVWIGDAVHEDSYTSTLYYTTVRVDQQKYSLGDVVVFEENENVNHFLDLLLKGVKCDQSGQVFPQKGDIDMILGGPPCQGFSGMNSFVDYYRPKYLLFENVRNFALFKNSMILKLMMSCLVGMGYQCQFAILQSGLYGLPQTRRRTIIIGSSSGNPLPKYPEPTHVFSRRQCQLSITVDNKKYMALNNTHLAQFRALTVADAISDLPHLTEDYAIHRVVPYDASHRISHYQMILKQNVDENCLNDHFCREMSELTQLRIRHIPHRLGSDWRDLPNICCTLSDGTIVEKLKYTHKDLKNGNSSLGELRGVCQCAQGLDCNSKEVDMKQKNTLIPWCLVHTANRQYQWSGLYGRLALNGYFPTTVTNPQPISKQGRVLHPNQNRIISVRESARSQGFPDHFILCGSVIDKYRQIGNAVPIPLSIALAKQFYLIMQHNSLVNYGNNDINQSNRVSNSDKQVLEESLSAQIVCLQLDSVINSNDLNQSDSESHNSFLNPRDLLRSTSQTSDFVTFDTEPEVVFRRPELNVTQNCKTKPIPKQRTSIAIKNDCEDIGSVDKELETFYDQKSSNEAKKADNLDSQKVDAKRSSSISQDSGISDVFHNNSSFLHHSPKGRTNANDRHKPKPINVSKDIKGNETKNEELDEHIYEELGNFKTAFSNEWIDIENDEKEAVIVPKRQHLRPPSIHVRKSIKPKPNKRKSHRRMSLPKLVMSDGSASATEYEDIDDEEENHDTILKSALNPELKCQPNCLPSLEQRLSHHIYEAMTDCEDIRQQKEQKPFDIKSKLVRELSNRFIDKHNTDKGLEIYNDNSIECEPNIYTSSLLSDLEKRFEQNILLYDVCDILSDYAVNHFQPYIRYCAYQRDQEKLLTRLTQSRPQFLDVLQRLETNQICQNQTLLSFLMLPMQRITRYPLLIDAVCQQLPENSPILESSQKALGIVNQLVRSCNEETKKVQRMQELIEIEKLLQFKSKIKSYPIVSGARYLVKSGAVIKLSAPISGKRTIGKSTPKWTKSSIYLFLFSDLLILAKKKSESNYAVFDYCSRNTVQLISLSPSGEGMGPIGAVRISIPNNYQNLAQLILLHNHEAKTAEYTIHFNLESEKLRWIEAVSQPSSENPNEIIYEEWDCPQVQCIRSYCAQQTDEISLEETDVLNVCRKIKDGWFEGQRIRDGVKGWFPSDVTEEIVNQHVRARNMRLRHR